MRPSKAPLPAGQAEDSSGASKPSTASWLEAQHSGHWSIRRQRQCSTTTSQALAIIADCLGHGAPLSVVHQRGSTGR